MLICRDVGPCSHVRTHWSRVALSSTMAGFGLELFVLLCSLTERIYARSPNILFILADDMGQVKQRRYCFAVS